jgi:hypothetical protein
VPIGVANLTQDSVILCEQIRVVDKSRIIRVIGHLDRILSSILADGESIEKKSLRSQLPRCRYFSTAVRGASRSEASPIGKEKTAHKIRLE